MILTKKKSLELYHYCVSITDALRPILNTPEVKTLDFDNEYWIDSLTRFKKLLDDILGVNSNEFRKILTPILNGLLSNSEFTKSNEDIPQVIKIAFDSAIATYHDILLKRSTND